MTKNTTEPKTWQIQVEVHSDAKLDARAVIVLTGALDSEDEPAVVGLKSDFHTLDIRMTKTADTASLAASLGWWSVFTAARDAGYNVTLVESKVFRLNQNGEITGRGSVLRG